MYEYNARVKKIVDADTVDLTIDLGFTVWVEQRVRLWGIDAPERFSEGGKAAIAWLTDRLPLGSSVRVRTLKNKQDRDLQEKYGRYLAIIILPGGVEVNDELVKAGHAVEYMRES